MNYGKFSHSKGTSAALLCGLTTILAGTLMTPRTALADETSASVRAQVAQMSTSQTVRTDTDKELLMQLEKTLGKTPVDARVDRVWHAIPGLAGWSLDVPASLKASRQGPRELLRLVWIPIPPKVHLADLEAEPIYRGPGEEKSVALMFNVAWGEAELPSILSTLDKYHVKATFFLDGDWVKKNLQLARQLVQDGQAIGSHGSGHPDFRRLSTEALTRQIAGTNELISHTIGKKIDLLAPPAGAFDERTVRLARQSGVYTVLWTVDTIDWNRPPANVIVKRVMTRVESGSLILMHPTPPTASALPTLISRLTEQGYHFKTVEDVVHEHPATHPPKTLRRQA